MTYVLRTNVHGSCYCGLAKFAFTGPPLSIVHCHCRVCRRASGTAFSTWVTIDAASLLHLPDTHLLAIQAKDRILRFVCELCGTHVYSQDTAKREIIGFLLGSVQSGLENATVDAHYCIEQKESWYVITDDLPCIADKADFDPLNTDPIASPDPNSR